MALSDTCKISSDINLTYRRTDMKTRLYYNAPDYLLVSMGFDPTFRDELYASIPGYLLFSSNFVIMLN